MFVGVDDDVGMPARAGDGHRDELVVETSVLLGVDGACVRADRERVLRLPADPVPGPEILGGLDHAAADRVRSAAGGGTRPVEAVHQVDPALPHTGPQTERVVLDVRHRIGAAGDDEVTTARGDGRGRGQDRLQARPAATIELHAGNGLAQTGVECRDPPDGRRFTARVALAEHHVIDVVAGQPGACDQFAEQTRCQVGGGHRGQRATHAPHGRTKWRADDDVGR